MMWRSSSKMVVVVVLSFATLIGFSQQVNAALTPLNDDSEFVKQVYLDFLNRQPDADGLNYWEGQIDSGSLTRTDLVEQYLLSAEFGQTVSPVVRLYFTYYLRVPDYDGLMFWVNSYAVGENLNTISDAFASAQEFIDRYGSLNNEQFVSQMYINVYGRQPDIEGLAYWTDLLNSNSLTRGQVMVFFSTAEEYLSLSASQVYVAMTYMGLLRRAPDQDGFDYWVDAMDQGVSGLGLIESFLQAEEYAARFDVNIDDDGDGYTENQGDCSDLDVNTYPGATEICGDGIDQDCNGSDLACAASSIVGTWIVDEHYGSNNCEEPIGSFYDTYNVVVQETGEFSLRGVTFQGSISGNTISWTGSYSYPEYDGGTTTVKSVTVSTSNNGDNLSGSGEWTWTGGGFSCSGTSTLTGTRSN